MSTSIAVLVELTTSGEYRATAGTPFQLSAEAPTRDAALRSLHSLLRERIAEGAEIVNVPIDEGEHQLKRFAGWLPADGLTEEWKQAIADYRQQVEDADLP